MSHLTWAPEAGADVERLHRFLVSKDVSAAHRAVRAIRSGVQVLGAHPQIGRLVEGLPEAYREWPIDFGHSGYLVRYRIDGNAVTILAVRHQRELDFDL